MFTSKIVHRLFMWQQKSKHDLYRGEDSMKKFCTGLREHTTEIIARALPGLRQFLATESPLKMMENNYCTYKPFFVLKIFKFSSWLFSHVGKWID